MEKFVVDLDMKVAELIIEQATIRPSVVDYTDNTYAYIFTVMLLV